VKSLPYGLKGFGLFCSLLGLKLHGYEREILADYFAGTAIETVCIIPKKNGKSTLLAALALYHILMVRNAKCLIGASSRDQATLIFWQAEQMVNDGDLAQVFDVKGGYRHIRCGSSTLRVLAGDAATADGAGPTLALVDELHRHRNGDLYGVLRDGLTTGQMVTISTAGETLDSPLGLLRDAAYELANPVRKGAHRIMRSSDGAFVMHEWALAPGEDYEDPKTVKRANPAPWITIPILRRQRDSPTMTLGQWLRFRCGIWTEGEEPPIPPQLWDDLRGVFTVSIEEPVWVGVVLGRDRKETAIALVQERDGSFFTQVDILAEATYADVEARVREFWETFDVKGVVYTSKGFQRSADLLEAEGLQMIELPQSDQRMTEASATFWKLLEEGKLHHDGDKDLRAHVMSARTKETEKGWRFVMDPHSGRPVSALFALVATCHVALSSEPEAFAMIEWV
jgi:phage terminase large subunit-like protein